MTDHIALCRAAGVAVTAIPAAHQPEVLVGFDGFVDNIIDVVQQRVTNSEYTPFPTIASLGERISAAAGRSANLELVIKQSKLGGNGPIMANALCAQAHQVTVVGVLGDGALDPVFQELGRRAAKVISLGTPSVTDALEFTDGKVMLGKLQPMEKVTWTTLLAKAGGLEGVKTLFRTATGIATVNWTMTLGLTEIWRRLATEVLPGLRSDRPRWFIDLADPAKRTRGDILEALAALGQLQRHVDIVLGLNEAECRQILDVLDVPWSAQANEWDAAAEACQALQQRLGLSHVMCHLVRSAAVAWAATPARPAGAIGSNGFFEAKPLITTGAGDHFNAGFMGALLAGLEPVHCLLVGGATSGHYVRTAVSPSRAQVAEFLASYRA